MDISFKRFGVIDFIIFDIEEIFNLANRTFANGTDFVKCLPLRRRSRHGGVKAQVMMRREIDDTAIRRSRTGIITVAKHRFYAIACLRLSHRTDKLNAISAVLRFDRAIINHFKFRVVRTKRDTIRRKARRVFIRGISFINGNDRRDVLVIEESIVVISIKASIAQKMRKSQVRMFSKASRKYGNKGIGIVLVFELLGR